MEQQEYSPALANAAVILGFAVLLSTFATNSPWSVILGVVIVVAGGLWAGFAPQPTAIPVSSPVASASVIPDADTEDERDDGHTA